VQRKITDFPGIAEKSANSGAKLLISSCGLYIVTFKTELP
jgi:hypothetical protein